MSIYVTGDTHGDLLGRFSYSNNPKLRNLTEKDTMIILGDVGVPWPQTEKNNFYQLSWLNGKPWTTIFLLGNHDDYDWAESLPRNGSNAIYQDKEFEKIKVYFQPAAITVEDQSILLIPGGDSHDFSEILDPNQPNFKDKKRELKKKRIDYRVLGQTWWEQEPVNIEMTKEILKGKNNFDYILSHDFPGSINKTWKRGGYPGRLISTPGQEFLEEVRQTVDFKTWVHGHAHDPFMPWNRIDGRVHCLYKEIVQIN